jgi:hypothetical protein
VPARPRKHSTTVAPPSVVAALLLSVLACASGGSDAPFAPPALGDPADGGATLLHGTNDGAPSGSIHAPAKVVEIAANAEHACARLVDDRVFCWGGLSDQVCEEVDAWPAPREIASLDYRGITSMALGSPNCASLASGGVLCWGRYTAQAFGDGQGDPLRGVDLAVSCTPPVLADVDDVVSVSTGMDHACALRSDGTIRGWGNDDSMNAMPDLAWSRAFMAAEGGREPETIPWPLPVPGITNAVEVAASDVTCARLADGTARCWGGSWPNTGIAGVAPVMPRLVPLDHLVGITVGSGFGAAVRDDGQVFAFAVSTGADVPVAPVAVPELAGATRLFGDPWEFGPIEGCLCGTPYLVAMFPDGTLRLWSVLSSVAGGVAGGDATPVPPGDIPGAAGARLVAASYAVLCVVVGDDEIRCAGMNDRGQLGRGTVDEAPQPLAPVLWPVTPPQ